MEKKRRQKTYVSTWILSADVSIGRIGNRWSDRGCNISWWNWLNFHKMGNPPSTNGAFALCLESMEVWWGRVEKDRKWKMPESRIRFIGFWHLNGFHRMTLLTSELKWSCHQFPHWGKRGKGRRLTLNNYVQALFYKFSSPQPLLHTAIGQTKKHKFNFKC